MQLLKYLDFSLKTNIQITRDFIQRILFKMSKSILELCKATLHDCDVSTIIFLCQGMNSFKIPKIMISINTEIIHYP